MGAALDAGVSAALRRYAERGALRELVEAERDGEGYEASFVVAGGPRVRLVCDAARRSLVLRDLLPEAPARSPLGAEFGALLAACRGTGLPEHRRVDPALAELRPLHRGGKAGLELRLRGADWDWAAVKAVNLAHEVVVMVHDRWPEYAHRHYGASLE